MSIIPQLLILLSMLMFWVPALAQSVDPNPPPLVILNDDQGEYRLGRSMQILEDPAGSLTIQEVSSPSFSDKFKISSVETPAFGYSSSTYWVRFRLKNESHMNRNWLLELGFSNMQYVDLYLPSPDGEGFTDKQTGVLRPFNTRDIENHHIVFNLPLTENEVQTVYMRFQSGASMTLPLTVWSQKAFIQSTSLDFMLMGIFYGVFLIMLAFNLFLLLSLREANYLYFIFFLLSGLLLFISYDAIGDQYLWPNLPAINQYAVPLFFILFFASILKFTDNFLELRERKPNLHRIFIIALIGWGILLLLLPFVSYHVIFNFISTFWHPLFGIGRDRRGDLLEGWVSPCQVLPDILGRSTNWWDPNDPGTPWNYSQHSFNRTILPTGESSG